MTVTEPAPSPVELHPECQEHGCTADDCVCFEYEDEEFDTLLLAAALGRTGVDPDGYSIEYIEDGRMLVVPGIGPAESALPRRDHRRDLHRARAHGQRPGHGRRPERSDPTTTGPRRLADEIDGGTAMTTNTTRRSEDEPALSLPRELWSAPVAEARWCGTRPRLSRLLLLLPFVALLSAYAAAAAAAHAHVQLAGWLLALAVVAILGLATAVGRHAHRLARYRAEAPR